MDNPKVQQDLEGNFRQCKKTAKFLDPSFTLTNVPRLQRRSAH